MRVKFLQPLINTVMKRHWTKWLIQGPAVGGVIDTWLATKVAKSLTRSAEESEPDCREWEIN